MKNILMVIAALFPFATMAADKNKDFYAGGFVLLGIADQDNIERTPAQPTPLSNNSDSGGLNGGLGSFIGYDWNGKGLPIRTELGANWRYRHDMNISFIEAGGGGGAFATKSDVSTTDIIASVLYDLPVDWKWKPYVGGGIGAIYSDVDTYLLNPAKVNGPGSSGWDFAWQLQGGVNYPISQTLEFRADYRYIDLGTIETGPVASGDRFTADLISHDFRIGLSWKF